MKLSDREWGIFLVGDLFSVKRPLARNKDNYEDGCVPFVASGSVNNGVMKCCKPHEDESLDDGNCITVSPVDGSSFYQPFPFLGRGGAGSSVLLLYADGLNLYRGQFIARMISNTCSAKYTYGHMGNKDNIKRERIMLPATDDGEPDYQFMEDYVRELMIAKRKQYRDFVEKRLAELGVDVKIIGGGYRESLDSREWKEFSFSDVFEIKKGFYNKKPGDSGSGRIPFLGATDSNNGVTQYLTLDEIERSTRTGVLPNSPLEKKLFPGHAIAVTNNGSVGHAYYHGTKFTCSHDVNPLYLKHHEMNVYEACFLITLIEKQGKSFQYARKWRPSRMVRSKIMLPVTDTGEPDYQFMEDYIKEFMLKKYFQYLIL